MSWWAQAAIAVARVGRGTGPVRVRQRRAWKGEGTRGSTDIAKEKARSAVALRRPTKALQDAIAQGGANLRLLSTGFSMLEGGIPIIVDGKIIGSIGVSGVTSQQDAQTAQAGIDNLK